METQNVQQADATTVGVSIPVVKITQEATMRNITTLTRNEAWFRRGAAGLAALVGAGALAVGLAGGLQWNERRSQAVVPVSAAVVAAAPDTGALTAASEEYRAMYDGTFAARRSTAGMVAASEEYRAMYDRSFAAPGSAAAIAAASEEYRAMYDRTPAARPRSAAITSACEEYRAMYDRSFAAPGSAAAISAASEEYRAMYDRTLDEC